MERTGPPGRNEELTKIFPVRYAGIRMFTIGRKRTRMSAGTVTTAGIPLNDVIVRAILPEYHDIHESRNAHQEEQDYSDPGIHTENARHGTYTIRNSTLSSISYQNIFR